MLVLEAGRHVREGERDDAAREQHHPHLGGPSVGRRLVRRLVAQRWRRHRQAAHPAACGVEDARAEDLAVGLVVGLAVDVVGVALADGATDGDAAGVVIPNAADGAQFAASGAVGCGPGLALAGTLILPLLLAEVTRSAL